MKAKNIIGTMIDARCIQLWCITKKIRKFAASRFALYRMI
jgi:hypothetical protein